MPHPEAVSKRPRRARAAADIAEDERLIREALDGASHAWGALVEKYSRLIYSVPIRYGLTREDADDVFQAVCVDLLRDLKQLREPQALPAWLIRVAHNKCFRTAKRGRREIASEPEDFSQRPDGAEPAPDFLERCEEEQLLREALKTLPPRCRELVEMLFFADPPVPYAEVSRRLGLAVGSIGLTRRRCLEKLEGSLAERGL